MSSSGIIVKPFRGYIPPADKISEVIAPPYDVVTREEAAKMGKERPNCVIHINRPEIAFPSVDATEDCVYQKGAENLQKWIKDQLLVRADKPGFYAYRAEHGGHSQTGLYALVSCEQYEKGLIKKHEHTRKAPEEDRTKTVRIQNANVGSVFLAYRGNNHPELRDYVKKLTERPADRAAHLDFDNTDHELWFVDDAEQVKKIEELFAQVPHLYIADGHHRAASACNVWKEHKAAAGDKYTGTEPYCYFMACIFSDDELCVIDYNRVIKQNKLSEEELFKKLEEHGFKLTQMTGEEKPNTPDFLPAHHARPTEHKVFSLYIHKKWYRMEFVAKALSESAADNIDSKILTDFCLTPIFGIHDLRNDPRIKFIGGTRGLHALEEAVKTDDMLAIAVPPVEMSQLFDVSDEGQMMPPKSTWFVPKLADAMVIRMNEGNE